MRCREAEAGSAGDTFKIQEQDFVAGSSGGPGVRQERRHCGGHHGLCVHTLLSSGNNVSHSSCNFDHLALVGPVPRRGQEWLLGQSEPSPGISPIRTKGIACFPL